MSDNRPSDEEIRQVIGEVRDYDGLDALAEVSRVSKRTLQRQAARTHGISHGTRSLVLPALEKSGAISDRSVLGMTAAVERLREMAATQSRADAAAKELESGLADNGAGLRDRKARGPRE